jgi:alpha-amylase/alpha-mannosidase (GH57 family)
MPALRRIVIHGHFYQPPREDPWLEEIERQAGAAPWHDWNEKIEGECYRAVVAARVLDGDGRISRVMNTLSRMSFDVGPTLFEWMERAAPATYAAILDADRHSIARTGHGNAIAQPYHHVILPLASRRDKITEVRWGIADFTRRFGRAPAGMWLPETAVDDETLDVLAQEGIAFTILAPSQVVNPPPNGEMGKYVTANGRSIAIGIYDGDLSHGVAFGRLLVNARVWKSELLRGIERQIEPSVVSIATDGETFGHHHHFSEMALAWLLDDLERTADVDVTNYAAVHAHTPPQRHIEIVEPSSWSCTHGVERWRSNCGCRIAHERGPLQEWRAPLRAGLDSLRTRIDALFDSEGTRYFIDPWKARDAYGAVVAAEPAVRHAFVATLLRYGLNPSQEIRAREMLEMARDAMRMFTSCAWFFDDLTGLEVPQNLRYAARAIDLAGPGGAAMEERLAADLRLAHSSEPGSITAEDVWARSVRPIVPAQVRLAAGVAAAKTCVPNWPAPATSAFDVAVDGRQVTLEHRRTGRVLKYEVSVALRGVADVQAYVQDRHEANGATPPPRGTPALIGTVPVALAEFPERERSAVREAVRVPQRHELVRRLLGDATLSRVAHGDVTLLDATVTALTAEVSAIDTNPSALRAQRAAEMVDLLELLGRTVPFDVQTAFARALARLPYTERAAFAELAARLGFAREILDAPNDTMPAVLRRPG